ncbi:uncharacterized protein LOC119722328 isoform X2 [Patiria miniata]|uniref:FAM234A/B beta-propeller domain-containing protein n=1 Tax=Patiria miniata TaxID=46514 RepID=A0A913Z951_PATMI|nr:uncharacterized protein LOC119722328 isoform X2 [Patiria miniata]
MGAMGSFFNGGSRKKPRYERLPLDTFFPSGSTITRTHEHHDDLDEDNLLFDLDNQGSQNGRLLPAKNGYDSEEEIEFYKDTRRSRDRRNSPPSSCCCLVCLLVVLVVVALLFGALYLIRPRAQNTVGLGWTSSTYEYATETAMRLYDVNQDGIEDVILGAAVTSSLKDIESEIEFCRKHDMKYPCAGLIMALDGRNGTRLWTIYTEVEVFAIQCGKLDINQDGHMDCVAAGRMATLHGIDPIKGVILWSADPSVTNPHFNFYQGQVVPDMDQDGVQDFVVTHGGDTRFSEKELDRPAGRLLLLSGKTGRSLGRYLSLPDEHETYSAITLYTRHNGAVYLLFGSGGETIAGSLWTISLRDLYCYVMSITTCSANSLSHVTHLQSKGYEESWGTPVQTLSSGVNEIIRSDSSKGVTVPTELVDMNNDGIDDLVVFMYNSTITVLNGLNLEVIWSTGSRFVEFETYSNPAPGYFNDDDTVDLMVRLSKGTWPEFKSTYVYILDGRNGEILWYLKTPSIGPVMSSPLTLQSYGRKDAFIFWAQGLSGEITGEELEPPGHEMGPEMGSEVGPDMGPNMGSEMGPEGRVDSSVPPGRPRRHGEMGPEQPCLLSTDVFHADLLLVDRDLALKPLRLASIEAYKYNYSLTEEDRLLLKEKLHDDQDLGAMETVPPDTHVTPPSKLAPLPTKAMVTEEDLARHDLHRHMTTSANAVTTPEDVDPVTEAVVLPEGLEPTTIAATIPEEIGPSTEAGTLPEGLESTIKALTSPEGQESRAAMSTSEIIEETTLTQETIQTSSVAEVVELSTPSTTSLVEDNETSTLQPTDEIFSTGSENSTPMSTNSETTTKTLETTVSGVSTTSETTGTPREEITTVSMPETTTPLDLATDLLEATTEGSQTATETATSPDVNASASTLGLETSSLEATATSELATQSTQLPTTEFEDYPQRSTSESETGTLSLDDTTPPMEINSGPQAVNCSSPQAVNCSSPQAVNSSIPQAVNSSSPQAVNSSSPQAVNSSIPLAVNSSSPQAVNSSSPQAVNSSIPLAVNLTHTSSSNNKSDTDTNKPTSLPVSQGTNHSAEESHIETTGDDENKEPSLKEEVTNNNQSTTHLAELFTELGMVADQETSTPQKPETPASGSKGGEEHRRRRETSRSDLCLIYQPSLFGTGIIGDLDNDGNLDYVYVETQMAQLTDEDSHYLTTKLRLRVHRLVLKSAITRRDWVRLEDDQVLLSEGVSREEVDVEELEEHFRFLPADKQSWTSYMGKNGDEKFRKNNR